ncbi:hypothetical protein JG688_00015693 [Phytophthora aleatoria]|uniref:Uncharacterized protein n=1 Tax=Phytophthora aleatoria TaxID=2496075 RepID=A0A8J5MCU1_9STRA|nr:hypothetical protein JG688_00015693 [Phytophthora aleatoria]
MARWDKRNVDSVLEESSKRTRPKRDSTSRRAEDATRFDNFTFFKTVWKELREDGWTSKPPPRHALSLFYLNFKGPRGEGFLHRRGSVAGFLST